MLTSGNNQFFAYPFVFGFSVHGISFTSPVVIVCNLCIFFSFVNAKCFHDNSLIACLNITYIGDSVT